MHSSVPHTPDTPPTQNTPPRRGPARFAGLLFRHLGALIKLNLLWFLCLLPMLIFLGCGLFFAPLGWLFGLLALCAGGLLGPAAAAICFCITHLLQEAEEALWPNFKKAFIRNFRQGLLPGILCSLLVLLQAYASYILILTHASIGSFIGNFLSIFIFWLAAPYFFVQLPYLQLKNSALLQNSILLALRHAPRSIGGAVCTLALIALQLVLFPLSLPVILLLGSSLPAFLHLALIWPAVDKTFEISQTLSQRRAQQASLGSEPEQSSPAS